jgi:hypothetical protein
MQEPREITLAEIASQFAAKDTSFKYFHGKLFSYIPPDASEFASFAQALNIKTSTFPNSHPAAILIGKMGLLIPHDTRSVLTVENGSLGIHFTVSDLKLPDCVYLAIISPVEKSDSSTSYGLAFESINFIRALISASFGRLPFYSWIADFDFDATGKVAFSSKAIKMPLYADLARIADVKITNDICDRLSNQMIPYRQRLQRACNFYCIAMDQDNSAFRFSSYWIALEILVGGKSDAIRTALSKAYAQTSKRFSDEHLFYKEIERARHDLIHKGKFGGLPSYHERLLQAYFWDICSFQIGLKSTFALGLAKSGVVEEERKAMNSAAVSGAPRWHDTVL